MARPRKISKGVEQRILELIGQGFCIKETAREVCVSDITIKRHREKNPEFNRRFLIASKQSEYKIRDLKRLGIRTYRRKVEISPDYGEITHQKPPVVAYSKNKPETWMGLPIRPRPLDYSKDTGYYLNPNTAHVEIIQNRIVRVCPMSLWEDRHKPQRPEPFYGAVF